MARLSRFARGASPVLLATSALSQHAAPLFPNSEYSTERPSPHVSLVAADLDGDGRVDLAIGDGIADHVQILFSNGEGGVRPVADVQAFEGAGSIAVGDVDEDGIPDLVVACQAAGSVVFLRGLGEGRYAPPIGWFPNTTPRAVALGDLDRDGHLDLVVGLQDLHEIDVRRGDGRGGFGPPDGYSVGGAPSSIVLADLDLDGWPDLAVGHGDAITYDGVTILLGSGSGDLRFAEDVWAQGPFGVSFSIGDLDADGVPDLALTSRGTNNGQIEVLAGDGHGGFGNPRFFSVGFNAQCVVVADLDHDGRPDLLGCSASPPTMRIWYGQENGTLIQGTPVPISGQADSMVVADLDQDGLPDVAIATQFQSTIAVLRQDVSGSFAIPRRFDAGSDSVGQVVAADVDGDGHTDLVYQGDHGITCSIGDGSGGFSGGPYVSESHTSGGFAVADLDLDGFPDVVTSYAAGGITMLPGQGSGFFGPAVDFRAGFSWSREFAVGDLDGNGWPDVVATVGSTAEVAVFLGTGQGSFAPAVRYPTGSGNRSLAIADLDGDGALDLALTSANSSAEITILPGNGRGGFSAARTLRIDAAYHTLATADLDGDGRADLLVSSTLPDFSASLSVFLQATRGTFRPRARYDVGFPFGTPHFADLDGDGRLDAYFASRYQEVAVFLGDGRGEFPIRNAYIVGSPWPCGSGSSVDAAACDLDGDGRLDLAAVGQCTGISVLRRVESRTPGMPICVGDGSSDVCPCGNPGHPGHGCENSALTGGARLDSAGTASLSNDTLSLTSVDEPDSSLTIFLQGSTFVPRIPLGQGLLCAGGRLTRLYARAATAGVAVVPGPNGASVSSRSRALGDRLTTGSIRAYQALYRDAAHGSCRSTFDLSSGLQISWTP